MHVLINSWRDIGHEHQGGSEVLIDRLALGLHRRGHAVTLRAGGPTGSHPYRVVDGGGTFTQYLRSPLDLRQLGSIDVVVDVNNGVGYYTPLHLDVPTVSMVHHLHTHQWDLYFPAPVAAAGRFQESRVMPRAYRRNLFVVPSRSTGEALVDLGVRGDRIRILPMAVSSETDDGGLPRSREPLFVALGRVTAHKRIPLLLDMWEQVRPVTGGKLIVIGDGPDLEEQRERNTVGVEFTGRVDDATKRALLSSAWVLLHTAAWEGWGMVITEAALMGTAAIGFDVPGVRDAIDHERSGLLATDRGDFVAHWLRLAADPGERDRLGAHAAEWAGSRGADDQVAVLEETLYEAIDHHSGRGRPREFPVLGQASAHHPGPVDLRLSRERSGEHALRSSIDLSIVIPAYDEAKRLPALLEALLSGAIDLDTTELIVVDDGSADDTAAVAQAFLDDRFRNGEVVRLPKNMGKGAALRAGVARTRGAAVVMMDADLATDLGALPAILEALDDHHVAIGSRTAAASAVHNGASHRKFMALALNRVVKVLTSVEANDTQCGFKAFRGPVARLLFHVSMANGFGQDAELLDVALRLGLSVTEVPVIWTAVPGSKVRVVSDSARTLAEVGAHWAGVRSVPLVAGLSVRAAGVTSEVLAKELRSTVRRSDAVLDDGTDAHVLLPGSDLVEIELIASRLSAALPEADVRRWSCTLGRFAGWQAGTSLTRIGAQE